MADTLTTITKIINSPPGQLAAGGVLAGIVWKFFERVEAVLTDQTKLEIAVWLATVQAKEHVPIWPETFLQLFERVFGNEGRLPIRFGRSALFSISTTALSVLVALTLYGTSTFTPIVRAAGSTTNAIIGLLGVVVTNLVICYIILFGIKAVFATRRITPEINVKFVTFHLAMNTLAVFIALLLSVASVGEKLLSYRAVRHVALALFAGFRSPLTVLWYVPSLCPLVWLWLYAGSGLILKAASRFDIGFDWFNRKFDIEKKPLQSIGLVAGALVAIVYWTAVIVSRVVG